MPYAPEGATGIKIEEEEEDLVDSAPLLVAELIS
jgi:hypothetical protein